MNANGLGPSARHISAVLDVPGQLATGGSNVITTGFADGSDHACCAQDGGKSLDPLA